MPPGNFSSEDIGKNLSRPPLRPDMTLRQIAADYPACQEVLRRYGEPTDRPLPFGHLEPLEHFARRRGVPWQQLAAELAQAAGVPMDEDAPRAARCHRPFLTAALLLTLTLGAGWGMILLFSIGLAGDWQAVSAGAVVAHGAAQLWGFVGLFVLGIALRYLPATTGGPRPSAALCHSLLLAVLFGVLGGFFWSLFPASFLSWLGPASGLALVAAACLFSVFLLRQLGRSERRLPWTWPVLTAGLWLLVWGVTEMGLRWHFRRQGPEAYEQSMRQLLLEIALFGFILNAVYGFGQKLLPGIVGSATPRLRALKFALLSHNLGVVCRCLAHLGWGEILAWLGGVALIAGGSSYAWGMRGFLRVRRTTPRPEVGPGALRCYVQLAFGWLLLAFLLLLAGESSWGLRGSPLPVPYLGAIRHALTVGFLTTLILGVAQRLLPILGHTLLFLPCLVVPTLWLIGLGNVLRVGLEFATLFSSTSFWLLPVSAILEVAALVLFSVNALGTLWLPPDRDVRRGRFTERTSVAALLAEYPELEDHLFAWGVKYLGRTRSVPRELTLGTLCCSEGLAVEPLLARLHEFLQQRGAAPAPASSATSAVVPGP